MSTHLPLTADNSADASVPVSLAHWRIAWDSALRAVELDLEDAERLIERLHREEDVVATASVGDWVAPSLSGPVPTEFADRARALLQRQSDVSQRLVEAMGHVRTQRRALTKLDAVESRPVFIDRAL
ncbi:hypothetical protein [Kineococcus sp. SYSU DK001]|uniref:hypothetical protein n=1 Tax=Kineococcus sp. SYSU DK001 TaxID=3383122 RepID=UPI003D7D76DF